MNSTTTEPRPRRFAPYFNFPALALSALATVALVSCGLLPGSKSDAPRDVPRYDAKTFFDTVSLRGVSFAPDGGALLYSSDESGVFNAYTIAPEGGAATALTNSTTDAITAISYFPKDRRVIFDRDQGGNELDHVFVRGLDGRDVDLTPGENLKAQYFDLSGDEQSLWIATTGRDPRYFDLYRYSVATFERTLVFENTLGFDLGGVSLDGRYVALSMTRTNSDNDLFLYDTTKPGDAPRKITAHEGDVSHGDVAFRPDGKEILYTSDEGSEFLRLWAQDLATGAKRLIQEGVWDVASVAFTRDGRYRTITTNEDGRTVVAIHDMASDRAVELPDLGGLDILQFDIARDGKRMACLAGSDTSPANLFVVDLESRSVKKLTSTLSKSIDETALARCEVIRTPGLDGLPIPCLLYKPLAASPGNRVPALLMIHGGPGGQTRVGYQAAIQHLVNHGIAVLAVNNRGSSGYGKTFFHLDDRKHGEADLDDCVAARNWLATQPWCDGERVGIMGGSYGGYMVLAALAYRPEVFTLGIDMFGVSNWVRTLESIPPWWASMRDRLYAELGDPTADRERLMRQSPLFHAEKIRRPLLVAQGANDPRVLKIESDEIVAACKKNGVPVEYVVFPNEGHGFQRKDNRIAASEAYLAFCDRWLKASPAVSPK